jgi:hypothetical protein
VQGRTRLQTEHSPSGGDAQLAHRSGMSAVAGGGSAGVSRNCRRLSTAAQLDRRRHRSVRAALCGGNSSGTGPRLGRAIMRAPCGRSERMCARAVSSKTRRAVGRPDGEWPASAADAFLGDLRILAIAGEADASFVASSSDPASGPAARAGLDPHRIPGCTGLAHPSVRAGIAQGDPCSPAARASRRDDLVIAGGGQCLGQANDRRRAAWVTGGESVRTDGEVYVELPEWIAAIGSCLP